MNFLFVHNNFPAQFRHAAAALVAAGHSVVGLGSRTSRVVPGVRALRYSTGDMDVSSSHPFARRFDMECRRAEQVLYSLSSLRASGFVPDVVVAHPGWGEALPLRTVFPKTRIVAYCEFFYGLEGRDVGFDPEFPESGLDGHVALHLKNAATMFALFDCDEGLAPTHWQRSTFPEPLQPKIRVIHDGVDTDLIAPNPDARLRLRSGVELSAQDEVITFVARNLEPLRGYHAFMRALPRVLAQRPKAHVVIIGGDGTSYGAHPPKGQSWKGIYLDEVQNGLDMRRVHFTGFLGHEQYLAALQISSAHVYLTYPFVLSWSLLEAMSAGCVVIGSDTAPVTEVVDGSNGMLVPFFDTDALAGAVVSALRERRGLLGMRARARETVIANYDLRTVCLPQTLQFLEGQPIRRRRRVAGAV
jgi:glycosyltransferase involved in cell wall biosynthesis